MIKYRHIFMTIQMVTFLAALLVYSDPATAKTMDNYSFCSTNCRGAACNNASTKQDCKSKCSDVNIWKSIAITELNNKNQQFSNENDSSKKEKMLYNTDIAKCLGLKSNETHQSVPEPQPLLKANQANDKTTVSNHDLCAAAMAAVSQEMNLGFDTSTHQISNQDLFSIMEMQVGQ